MSDVGRLPPVLSVGAVAVLAALTAVTVGPAGATTTTSAQRTVVYRPSVSPSTISNRANCGHPTSAVVSTGTTGGVDHVTFRVQLGDRTTTLTATGSGSRWQAVLYGESFPYEHGSGTVRADAGGPGGTAQSGLTSFTIECRS